MLTARIGELVEPEGEEEDGGDDDDEKNDDGENAIVENIGVGGNSGAETSGHGDGVREEEGIGVHEVG